MLRRYSEVFRTLCAIADLGVIAAAWIAVCVIRFQTELLPTASDPAAFQENLAMGLLTLPIWHLLLRYRGLYEPRRGLSRLEETRRVLEVTSFGTLILTAVSFFWRVGPVSRLVLMLFWGTSSLSLIAFRAGLRYSLGEFRRRGYNQRAVLIVGTGILARAVFERFRDHPETGFNVIGFVGPSQIGLGGHNPPHLGSYAELHEIVVSREVDQVMIALDRSDDADPIKLTHELSDTTAAIRIVPDLLNLTTLQAGIEDFDGLPVIRLVESPLVGWAEISKRAVDIGIASSALLVLSPVLAAIGIGIRLGSRGPVLFSQQRMSLDGKLFTMHKFRTMVPDAESKTGPVWAKPDDPRRTTLGRWLRKLNFDELPQLWNVVRGDMSIVGPRPERPEFIQDFRKEIPGYMQRHKMKGGLTGWAQVNGCRGNTSITKRLEYDMEYMRRWSLLFDMKIIALTFLRSFRDPNAY